MYRLHVITENGAHYDLISSTETPIEDAFKLACETGNTLYAAYFFNLVWQNGYSKYPTV
jgi:hypothetical protein